MLFHCKNMLTFLLNCVIIGHIFTLPKRQKRFLGHFKMYIAENQLFEFDLQLFIA